MTTTACWCGAAQTRLYATGRFCDSHTPAKQLGRAEPDTKRYCAPNRCYCGNCTNWTERSAYTDNLQRTTTDIRAIVTGKRRSSLTEYRNAQAHLRSRTENAR